MAIIGDLSIEVEDGTTLRASTDLSLAWKWAEQECGEEWDRMPWFEKNQAAAQALSALREAYEEVTE